MVPRRYIDLAKAATPEELHAAVLRFSLDQVWDQPWVVYNMGGIPSTRELLVCLDLPYHLEWPDSDCFRSTFGVRKRSSGNWTSPMGVLVPPQPGLPVELMWRLAITTGCPVLSYPQGIEHMGTLIPPDASPMREALPGPEGLSEAYGGIVACPGSFDQMQCTLFRSMHPVSIPGFPKFAWENISDPPQFSIKGRSVL